MSRQKEMVVRFAEIMEALSTEDSQILLAFAEFLSARAAGRRSNVTVPIPIPRPAGETVVAAIRRLSAQYPMLDSGRLFDVASRLMGEHLLGGREAEDIIAQLQMLFESHYLDLVRGEQSVS